MTTDNHTPCSACGGRGRLPLVGESVRSVNDSTGIYRVDAIGGEYAIITWLAPDGREVRQAGPARLKDLRVLDEMRPPDLAHRLLALWSDACDAFQHAAGQSGFDESFAAWSGASKDLLIDLGLEWNGDAYVIKQKTAPVEQGASQHKGEPISEKRGT